MNELEFCKVCGSLKPVDGVCDVCYDRKEVQVSGPPEKNFESE